jgi:SAM-dependent methyltransferase
MNILSFLRENKGADLDSSETTLQHRKIILRKSFLKNLYIYWYRLLLEKVPENEASEILEIGSGGGFIKTLNSKIITSDILDNVDCDLTFSAECLPFADYSLDAILMIDVLHHLPDCKKFFSEACRTLKKGGRIVMIEPANTILSGFIYKHFHHENFNPDAKEWSFPTSGPLSGANGALPWIIFKRDYTTFKQLFPDLSCESIVFHTPFAYLVSGGLSYKSLLPGWLFGIFKIFETIISPLNKWISMFQTITVCKD